MGKCYIVDAGYADWIANWLMYCLGINPLYSEIIMEMSFGIMSSWEPTALLDDV